MRLNNKDLLDRGDRALCGCTLHRAAYGNTLVLLLLSLLLFTLSRFLHGVEGLRYGLRLAGTCLLMLPAAFNAVCAATGKRFFSDYFFVLLFSALLLFLGKAELAYGLLLYLTVAVLLLSAALRFYSARIEKKSDVSFSPKKYRFLSKQREDLFSAGDVLYLSKNETAPCDCRIVEGSLLLNDRETVLKSGDILYTGAEILTGNARVTVEAAAENSVFFHTVRALSGTRISFFAGRLLSSVLKGAALLFYLLLLFRSPRAPVEPVFLLSAVSLFLPCELLLLIHRKRQLLLLAEKDIFLYDASALLNGRKKQYRVLGGAAADPKSIPRYDVFSAFHQPDPEKTGKAINRLKISALVLVAAVALFSIAGVFFALRSGGVLWFYIGSGGSVAAGLAWSAYFKCINNETDGEG